MKQRNQGFSLIELVVVIAVMTVLTLGIGLSLSSLTNQKVHTTAESIKSRLQYTQNQAMSKTVAYGQIMLDEEDNYVFFVSSGTKSAKKESRKKLGTSKEMTLYFKTNKDVAEGKGVQIDRTHPCTLTFQKSSGALQPMVKLEEEGEISYESGVYCEEILIVSGERREKIKLYPKTGKMEIEE